MKKIIQLLFLIIPFAVFSQNIDNELKNMILNQSTITEIGKIIDQTIESNNQNSNNPENSIVLYSSGGIVENNNPNWKSLKDRVKKKGIESFINKLIPIYKEVYTKKELKSLLKFSNSKDGKSIQKKELELRTSIGIMAMTWSQELNEIVLKELEERNRTTVNNDDIQKFEDEFTKNNNVEIVNLKDLKIDNKRNPGTFLIDFEDGSVSEVIVEIKNIGKEDLILKTFAVLDDEFSVDYGDKAIKPNETRKIYFRLDKTKTNYSSKYTFVKITSNTNFSIPFALNYEKLEHNDYNPVSFKINETKIKFSEFDTEFSKPYIFKFTNTSENNISLNVDVNNSYVYLNFPKGKIIPNETVEISVVYSKKLMDKYKSEIKKTELKVNVSKYINLDLLSSFEENDKSIVKLIIE